MKQNTLVRIAQILILLSVCSARAADPEKTFKMKFCQEPNLLAVTFFSQSPIAHGCIYSLAAQGYMLTVAQSVPGGIIVGPPNGPSNGKSIFIKTKKQYADGDTVHPQFVHSIGIKQFKTVLGAPRSLNAFQYLGDGVEDPVTQDPEN